MAKEKGATEEARLTRYRITIKGIVQGVGFRPFIFNLAEAHGIKGTVLNSSRGVIIEAEGPPDAVAAFCKEVRTRPPRLARIIYTGFEELEPAGYANFEIVKSAGGEEKEALVPPDVALCADCARETFDPKDRHYLYPFTNCTNCGPRFTIVREIPYDRPKTSMAEFPMCPDCEREYHDPRDRRFHAQPVACPACGPHVEFVDRYGRPVEGDWAELCWDALKRGKIVALKSLGGFHLVCDARNPEALRTLRRRKGRAAKPFAVMCRDLDTVRRYCYLDAREEELLTSPQAPIVVLKRREGETLPGELAPGLETLGVMIPYTPLHFLVFRGPFDILVMTSGNYSELPLAKDNAAALEELGGIADYFLWHNRDIVNRCDDSLAAVVAGEVQLLRRSRGYVPHPVLLPYETPVTVLGMGGEMKNTFCLWKKDQAFVSQHIGELDSLEGEENLFTSLLNFQGLIGVEPEVVGFDAHPDYRSSRLASRIPVQARFEIQHHHAHMVSCLAENGHTGPAVGIILDGTGYGEDGTLWGFEILSGDDRFFERLMHLAPVPLPAGEQAVKNPWRTAVSYLVTHLGEDGERAARRIFAERGQELEIVLKLVKSRFNSPLSSGCGRFFDAVAALTGFRGRSTYEGQPAIELGECAPDIGEGLRMGAYPFTIEGKVINPAGVIAGVVDDLARGTAREIIAARFHNTVMEIVLRAAREARGRTGLNTVALSGGTWQNRYLFSAAKQALPGEGFELLVHRQVPANDGGLCLGQAVIAYRRWEGRCV
ncbi:carbamoyltransferase HypF [Desulforudis sp. 1088]|uniref:carbamoyltransferase HypF n=2 Tax=Candidatus Desulforudis TaxID=471826 RepID=UPI003490F71D